MKTKQWSRAGSVAVLALVALLTVSGCDDDNPAAPAGDLVCDHLDADGVVVELSDGTTLLHQWEGVVTGEIEIAAGAHLDAVQVWFLDADSTRVRPAPECVDQSLAWVVADTGLVTIDPVDGQVWAFDLQARDAGETNLRLQVIHGDHPDFTSLALPIHVHEDEPHSEPQGAVLRIDGHEVARVDGAGVTGRLDAFVGEASRTVDVTFLDAEGEEFPLVGHSSELRVVAADPAAVRAAFSGSSFTLEGLGASSTTVQVVVWHDGHADYTSTPIPVEVYATLDVGAILVLDGRDWAASADFAMTGAWGPILVERATTRTGLRIGVPDREDVDHRFLRMLQLPADVTLEASVGDGSVVTLAPSTADPFVFDLSGDQLGSTTLSVTLRRAGSTIYASPPIPIVVFERGQGDPEPTFQLRLNGRTELGVVDGQLQAVDTRTCGSRVWMDRFEQSVSDPLGPLTDLIGIRVFDDECRRVDYDDDDFHLAFVFGSRGVARTTGHPEHRGEKLNFHVEATEPGTTSFTMVMLNSRTLEVEFVSPEIPVTIVP